MAQRGLSGSNKDLDLATFLRTGVERRSQSFAVWISWCQTVLRETSHCRGAINITNSWNKENCLFLGEKVLSIFVNHYTYTIHQQTSVFIYWQILSDIYSRPVSGVTYYNLVASRDGHRTRWERVQRRSSADLVTKTNCCTLTAIDLRKLF